MANKEKELLSLSLGELIELNTALTILSDDLNHVLPHSPMAVMPPNAQILQSQILEYSKMRDNVLSAIDAKVREKIKLKE